jgi:hypothetical protein
LIVFGLELKRSGKYVGDLLEALARLASVAWAIGVGFAIGVKVGLRLVERFWP